MMKGTEMKRKSYAKMACPIARSLEHVGDWWNILILRDASYGVTRFDHFQKALGIGTASLTRRLNQLVKAGLLEKHRYNVRPVRYEYLLTDRGREFRQVMLAFVQFGNRNFSPDGATHFLADRSTGLPVDLGFYDRLRGREISPEDLTVIAGPNAAESTRLRLALSTGEISQDVFAERIAAFHKAPSREKGKSLS
jgi:DNA-binding HxlR family transcriptional regulator